MQKQQDQVLNEEELKTLKLCFENILDKSKKQKYRYNAIQEAIQIIQNQEKKESVTSWLDRCLEPNKRQKQWKSWVNQNYNCVFEVIQERITKQSESFFSKLINTNQEKDVLQAFETLAYVFDVLEAESIKELMQGVYKNSITHILYCCLEYKNKFFIRTLGLNILFIIISSYELHQFSKLHELSLLTLFTYLIDFQSLSKPIASNSIRELCIFNSYGSGKPSWAAHIKDSNPQISELQYLDEIWKYMQRDEKNARKWLVVLSRTWFQLVFNKKYLNWTTSYFRNSDTVTKHYYLLTGLALDQLVIENEAIQRIQSAFLKQINFFLVILSTSKKERIRERKSSKYQMQPLSISEILEEKEQMLSQEEYLQILELVNNFFQLEEFMKISNDIVCGLSDQTVSLGDYIPISIEKISFDLLMLVIERIEDSIPYEIAFIKKKQPNWQSKVVPRRMESFIYCLHRMKEDLTRMPSSIKIFCMKVIKIAKEITTIWIPVELDQTPSLALNFSKILMDLIFLLLSYLEKILLIQLENSNKQMKEITFSELDKIRETLEQYTCQLLNRYCVLKHMGGYVKSIVISFLEKLYCPDNQQLFSGKVIYKNEVLKDTQEEINQEDLLQLVFKCLEKRAINEIENQEGEEEQETIREFRQLNLKKILNGVLTKINQMEKVEVIKDGQQDIKDGDQPTSNSKKKFSASFTPERNIKELEQDKKKKIAQSANNSFIKDNNAKDLSFGKNPHQTKLEGNQFLSKQEIESNIMKFIHLAEIRNDQSIIEEEEEQKDSKDIADFTYSEHYQSQSEIEMGSCQPETQQMSRKSANQPVNNLWCGDTVIRVPSKSSEQMKRSILNTIGCNNDQCQKRSSSLLKNKAIQQEAKLEELSTQLLLLLFKAQLLCCRQNDNEMLCSKYAFQFLKMFSNPYKYSSINQQNNNQSNSKQQASGSNKIQALSQPMRFPSKVSVILTVLSPLMNEIFYQDDFPSIIQQEISLKQEKLLEMCFQYKSFFKAFSKVSQIESVDSLIFNRFRKFFDYSLSQKQYSVLSTLSFLSNKNIFLCYPQLLSDISLINQLLSIAQNLISLILTKKAASSDLFYLLQILYASRDPKSVQQQKGINQQDSSSTPIQQKEQQISSNSNQDRKTLISQSPSSKQLLKNNTPINQINSSSNVNISNQKSFRISLETPSLQPNHIKSQAAKSSSQAITYSPISTSQNQNIPQVTSHNQTIDQLNLKKKASGSSSSSAQLLTEEDYMKKVKSKILKSIIILIKSLSQAKNLRDIIIPFNTQLISILSENLTMLLELGSEGIFKIFTLNSISHLFALFFILLLDSAYSADTKRKIWDFVLKCLQVGGTLVPHCISFIDSFAMTEQISFISKNTINQIMKIITQTLTDIASRNPQIVRQLLNCLQVSYAKSITNNFSFIFFLQWQRWIFNFKYLEISNDPHNKNTNKFMENLVKTLGSLSLVEELQPEVHFFLSQLLKNYIHHNQDQISRFSSDKEDHIYRESQNEDKFVKQRENFTSSSSKNGDEQRTFKSHLSEKNQKNFPQSNVEPIYQMINCHEQMKQQQIIYSETSKIEKEILKKQEVSSTPEVQSTFDRKGTLESQKKNQIKKRGSQMLELNEMVSKLISGKYLSFSISSDKLLSFLIDKKKQLFIVLRDVNGKFVWKIPENLFIEDEEKVNANFEKIKEMEYKKKNSKDLSSLMKIRIEQIINFIHESIAKSESFKVEEPFEYQHENDEYEGQSGPFEKVHPSYFDTQVPRLAASQFNLSLIRPIQGSESEILGRSISNFLKEIPFIIRQDEKFTLINHTDDSFLNTINQIDSYSTSNKLKIGVLYMGYNKFKEFEILQAEQGSIQYELFLERLGEKVRLSNHSGFLGGLSSDRDGDYAIYNHFYNCEVIYHVATMMPTKNKEDKQLVSKKRHIGNDFINIVWNDSGKSFYPSMVPSQLTTAYIIIQPLKQDYFAISLLKKEKMEEYFFPWVDQTIVHFEFLHIIVKIVSLQASLTVQQFQARNHQNIPQNTLQSPFKSRQNLFKQAEEQLSLPGIGNQLIGEVFNPIQYDEQKEHHSSPKMKTIQLSPRVKNDK